MPERQTMMPIARVRAGHWIKFDFVHWRQVKGIGVSDGWAYVGLHGDPASCTYRSDVEVPWSIYRQA